MKRCIRCGNEYPATTEYFYARPDSPDGLRNDCRDCHQKRSKQTYLREIDKRKAYSRLYYQENRERLLEKQLRYEAQNRERAILRAKAQRLRNPEGYRLWQRRYRQENQDRLKETSRAWRIQNRERVRDFSRQWRAENRRRRQVVNERREARKLALPFDFSPVDWQFALDYFNGCCAACGRPAGLFHTLAMDHFVALSSPDCPGTVPANIIPLCHGVDGCNNSKHDRTAEEWLMNKFGKKQGRVILAKIHDFFSCVRQSD